MAASVQYILWIAKQVKYLLRYRISTESKNEMRVQVDFLTVFLFERFSITWNIFCFIRNNNLNNVYHLWLGQSDILSSTKVDASGRLYLSFHIIILECHPIIIFAYIPKKRTHVRDLHCLLHVYAWFFLRWYVVSDSSTYFFRFTVRL